MRIAGAAAAALALAGCQSAQAPSTAPASQSAYLANNALSETIRTCWFSGDPAFAGFIYAPESNLGSPRILILTKDDPQGRPSLVIEPKGAGVVDVYGPLLQSEHGARISTDVARWRTGSEACA
jgi:hypothetical protein